MNNKQKYALIVAGGRGKRMGNDIPKQFIEVNERPILMHTIQRFYDFDNTIKIIVVLPESQHIYWTNLIKAYNFKINHQIAKGGIERFHSVLNGLQFISQNSMVAIHDGVRPLVSVKTIQNCFEMATQKDTAVPVIPATESIRKVYNGETKAVDRNHYFMVQTPQVFKSEIILNAYKQEFECTFTDDASVVEKLGVNINVVEGNIENIKITRPFDLIIAKSLLPRSKDQ